MTVEEKMKEASRISPEVKLTGEDNNGYALLNRCRKAWMDAGGNPDIWEDISDELLMLGYAGRLATIARYFRVL